MPSDTIPGTNRQVAESVTIMTTPTASHITPTSSRNPGLDGRRPIWTSWSSGTVRRRPRPTALPGALFGATPPFGVTRPLAPDVLREPDLRRWTAMVAQSTGTREAGPSR